MKEKIRRFLSTRHGNDSLTTFLIIAAAASSLLSIILRSMILQIIGYLLIFFALFRVFSSNHTARARENYVYLQIKEKIRKWFLLQKNKIRDRKTHRYFRCPNCKNPLRIPKGHGEVTVTCPVCRTKFDAKT